MHKTIETRPLFILEMANNHNGSIDHGIRIVNEFHGVISKFKDKFDFGFKLQYRDLDTYIHPAYINRRDIKYVKRLLDTRLSNDQKKQLKDEIQAMGFITICTPWDEKSVDLVEEHGFEIIKISSASLTDWPLLERIAVTGKPIIASTGGATIQEIDNIVSFFEHRKKQFSLMHCVAIYPTTYADLQLNQITFLQKRYPHISIGYSTHEAPDNYDAIGLAIAKGAKIFEKHVGIPSEKAQLNNYSASPEQTGKWVEAAIKAFEMCGIQVSRPECSRRETDSLIEIRRGAFARHRISRGEKIEFSDLFLATPTASDQLTVNDLSKYTLLHASEDIEIEQPILNSNSKRTEIREKVYRIVQDVKAILKHGNIAVQPQLELEIDYYYGIDRYNEFGSASCVYVNRDYSRRIVIMLPGQTYPEQYHKSKEETFIVLSGDLVVTLDGVENKYSAGDGITIEKGCKHMLRSQGGVVFEEISISSKEDDSHFTDPLIGRNKHRKTELTFWLD